MNPTFNATPQTINTTHQILDQDQKLEETKLSISLPQTIFQNHFQNLESVFLELPRFKNLADLVFNGHVTLIVKEDFVNPKDKIFSSIKGLTIKAGLVRNPGSIFSKGQIGIESPNIDNSTGHIESTDHLKILSDDLDNSNGFLKGNSGEFKAKINNYNGNIIFPSKGEITAYAGSDNTNGNLSAGDILQLNGDWNNANGILLGKKGIIGNLLTFENGEKGIVKSSEGLIEIVTQNELILKGFMDALKDISLTSMEDCVSILNAVITTPQKINIHSKGQGIHDFGVLVQYSALNSPYTNINSSSRLIRLEEVNVHGGLFIVSSQNIQIEKSELDLESLEITGSSVVSKESKYNVKKILKVVADSADFSKVSLKSQEEDIILETKETGYYEECDVVSEKGSVKYLSEGKLFLLKVVTFAKRIIRQNALDFTEKDNVNNAGELLSQTVKFLSSLNVQHFSHNDILINAEEVFAPGLTASAMGKLTLIIARAANLMKGNFLSKLGIEIQSLSSFIDVTGASFKGKQLSLLSYEQIKTQDAKINISGKVVTASLTGWIEAQRADLTTVNDNVYIEAPQGTLYLEANKTSIEKKLNLIAQFLQIENNKVNANEGISIKGTHLYALLTEFTSKKGNIALESVVSMWLDQVTKRAQHGQITEKSENWIYENSNDNKANEIVREAKHLEVVHTKDKAGEISNTATETATIDDYVVDAKKKIALRLGEMGIVKDSQLTAPNVDIEGDLLWITKNRMNTQRLDVNSSSLLMQKNEIEARLRTSINSEGSAYILDNTLKAKLNKLIAGENLSFNDNKVTGNLKLEATDNLEVSNNTLKEGNLHFKSEEKNVAMRNNELDEAAKVEVFATKGTVQSDGNHGDLESLHYKAKTISQNKDELFASEDMKLKADEILQKQTQLNSEQSIKAHAKKILFIDDNSKTIAENKVRLTSDDKTIIKNSFVEGQNNITTNSSETAFHKVTFSTPSGDQTHNIGNGSISDSTFKSQDDQNFTASNSQTDKSIFVSEQGDYHLHADNASKKDTVVQAANITEEVKENLISLNNTHIATEDLTQKSTTNYVEKGTDQAQNIIEEHEKSTHIEHEMHANDTAQFDVKDMGIHNSSVVAPNISFQNESLIGTGNEFAAEEKLEFTVDNLVLPKNTFESKNINFEGEKANLSQSQLAGNVNFSREQEKVYDRMEPEEIDEEGVKEVGLQDVTIHGSLRGKGLGNVAADNLNVIGDSVDLNAQSLSMPKANIHVNKKVNLASEEEANLKEADIKVVNGPLTISSNTLDGTGLKAISNEEIDILIEEHAQLNNAKLSSNKAINTAASTINLIDSERQGQSIRDNAEKGISAAGSKSLAENQIEQTAGSVIDLERAKQEAGEKIVLTAGDGINNHKGSQKAPEITVETSILDNTQGKLKGEFNFTVDAVNNQGGQLIAEYQSIIQGRLNSDSNSKIAGSGSLQVFTEDPIDLKGKIEPAKTFSVESPQVTLDTKIKAENAILTSTDGKTIIKVNAGVYTKVLAKISGREVDNKGQVHSEQTVHIHQDEFDINIGDVKADRLLKLSSDSAIVLEKTLKLSSSLELESQEYIDILSELIIGGDLRLIAEEDINTSEKVTVAGMGVFKSTTGNVNFNRNKSRFGNGIHVKAKKNFNLNAADVNVKGNSSIDVNKWNINAELNSPIDKIRGRFPYRRKNTSQAFDYTQSNFRLKGDLELNARKKVLNDGSNILINGDVNIFGKDFENIIRSHIWSHQVQVGKKKKKTFGIKHGSTRIYETRNETIVDSVANTQFKNLHMKLKGTLNNNGVFLANTISGESNNFFNGFFNKIGQSPTTSKPIPTIPGMPTPRLGGQFEAANNINFTVRNKLHNTGFIQAGNENVFKTKIFINEQRVCEEKGQSLKVKALGRHSKNWKTIDFKQPGGEFKGRVVAIEMEEGVNKGGLIQGKDFVYLNGHRFLNQELALRKINHLKSGSIAPWKSGTISQVETQFKRALIVSGGPLTMLFTDGIKNSASSILGAGKTYVDGGKFIEQTTRFSHHKSKILRSWNKSADIHSINKEEGSIRSINGPLYIKGDDLTLEGEIGCYNGKLIFDWKNKLKFPARTYSVENKTSSLKIGPTETSYTKTKQNTTSTSLPHVFAGDGMSMKSETGHIEAQGLQVDVTGDVEIKALSLLAEGHKVETYIKSKGISLSVQFLGSSLLNEAFKGKDKKDKFDAVKAIMRSDPALSSLYDLLGSKDTGSAINGAVMTGVNGWNELSQFSKALNQTDLLGALGQHFGLGAVNEQGGFDFKPRISVTLTLSKQETRFVEVVPSRWNIRGSIKVDVADQTYRNVKMDVENNADFNGKRIKWETEASTVTTKSSSVSGTVSYGAGGWGGGGSYSQSEGKTETHDLSYLHVGKTLNVNATEKLTLNGAEFEAKNGKIVTPHLEAKSLQDTSSQKQMGFSASSTGDGSFSASNQSSKQVNNPTAIKFTDEGTIVADKADLEGVLIQNAKLEIKELHSKDIKNETKGFSLGLTVVKPPENPQGFTNYGSVDIGFHKQESKTVTTISGGNGKDFAGVNTDPSRMEKKKKKQNLHVIVPVVIPNGNALQNEYNEIKQAFTPAKMETPAIQVTDTSKKPNVKSEPDLDKTTSTIPEIVDETESKKTSPNSKKSVASENSKSESKKSDFSNTNENYADLILQNNLKPLKRQEVLDHMAAIGQLAKTMEVLDYLPEKIVDGIVHLSKEVIDGIVHGVKKTCSSHPMINATCHKVSRLALKSMVQIYNEIPSEWKAYGREIKNEILSISSEVTKNIHENIARTIRYNQALGIDPALTKDYYKNVSVITFASFPFLGKIKHLKTGPIGFKRFIKEFESVGYNIVPRGKGSHIKMTKLNSPMVIIPHEKELPRGTANNLKKMLESEQNKVLSNKSTIKNSKGIKHYSHAALLLPLLGASSTSTSSQSTEKSSKPIQGLSYTYIGKSVKETDALILRDGMGDLTSLYSPIYLTEHIIQKGCQYNQTSMKICNVIGDVLGMARYLIPEKVRNSVKSTIDQTRTNYGDLYLEKYNIPKNETNQAFESLLGISSIIGGGAVGKLGKGIVTLPSQVKQLKTKGKILLEKNSNIPFLIDTFKTKNHIIISDTTSGRFHYGYMQRKDGALRVFVELLEARNPQTSKGLAIKAMREIKELGEKLNVTNLQLQFVPFNKELFKLVEKRYVSLGDQKMFPPHTHLLRGPDKNVKLPVFSLSVTKQKPKKNSSIPEQVGALIGTGNAMYQGIEIEDGGNKKSSISTDGLPESSIQEIN